MLFQNVITGNDLFLFVLLFLRNDRTQSETPKKPWDVAIVLFYFHGPVGTCVAKVRYKSSIFIIKAPVQMDFAF